MGNGKEITAVSKGTITLPSALGPRQLNHVLYVPDIRSNLISVAHIVDEGFNVVFTRIGCTVIKLGIEKAI